MHMSAPLHDVVQHGLEDALVVVIVDAILKREVDCIVLARVRAYVFDVARAGEVLPELVCGSSENRTRHDRRFGSAGDGNRGCE